ncbi:MAG: hypothetical protein IT325_09805 [Anaerolineae bacterium]|nr:hypothetical protein [Anaerolineae bacterium]
MTDSTFAPTLTPEQMALPDDELRRQGLPVPTARQREEFAHRRRRAAQQQAELAQDAQRPSSRWVDPTPQPHVLPTWAQRQLDAQQTAATPEPRISKVIIWQNPAENYPAKPDSGEEGRPAGAVQESPGREGLTAQQVLACKTLPPSSTLQRRRPKGA